MLREIRNKFEWKELTKNISLTDTYFTYDYHKLCCFPGDIPVLLYYTNGVSGILFPLIYRNIEGTKYKDATSVYGYSGPIQIGHNNKSEVLTFLKQLRILFKKNNIVSVFSRLHPYIKDQGKLLSGIGVVEKIGRVVRIDLEMGLHDQWKQISPRFQTYINKSNRLYNIRLANSKEELKKFIGLYYQTMKRLNAQPRYLFEESYFLNLWESDSFETIILLAENQEKKVIGGAMFLCCDSIIHYHLSGTHQNYIKLNPIKALLNRMREIGKTRGFKIFNLGGGVGGMEDSLFEFKSKFSKSYYDFNVWKYIVNEEVYNQLNQTQLINKTINPDLRGMNYFPSYRYDI